MLSREHYQVTDFFTIHSDEITCECDLCKLVFATSTQHRELVAHLESHKELKPLYHLACGKCANSSNDFLYTDFCTKCGNVNANFYDTTFYKVEDRS